MAKKLKLQQERAVIPTGNSGLGAKTVTSGESARHIQRPPQAGAEPDITAKRAMTGAPADGLSHASILRFQIHPSLQHID